MQNRNRNRNRRNRNFLPSRNRNRNKMESQKFSQIQYKIVYLISFILFSFTFYNKFNETFQLKNFFAWSRYGARTGTVTCQKSGPEP